MKRLVRPQIRGEVSARVGMLLLVPKPLQRGPGRSAIPPSPAPLRSTLDGHIRSSVPTELVLGAAGRGRAGTPVSPREGPCWHAVPLAAQAAVGGGPGSRAALASGRD